MSLPSITITIPAEAAQLAARLRDQSGLHQALAREMDRQNQFTIGHLVKTRLTGKGPFPVSEHRLGERTHMLRRSPRATPATVSGNSIHSAIGSNVKYAGIHEFGGTITRVMQSGSVRLRTDKQGNLLRQGANGKLAVFAKKSHKQAKSVAFAGGKRVEISIPARAPFQHAIADRADEYGNALGSVIISFFAGGKAGAN